MDVTVALGAMAVRAGGCSGMSYVMDLTKQEDVDENDTIVNLDENMRCVIDPKSLMFLYGMQLDYSDELIGGGFSFSNPNAEETCGCGKSCVPVVCHFRKLSTQTGHSFRPWHSLSDVCEWRVFAGRFGI